MFRKHRYHAMVILILLALSGCCIETKDKPGVVVRGDWSLELNRSRAIEEDSRKKKGHHAPCGRWGCLICALGPSVGEEGTEAEEAQKPLTITPPQYTGQCNPGDLPSGLPYPGISPFYAGTPGIGMPFGAILPPPIPVINPRTGQQHFMQPVMPGQPGVLMLHAQNGQPIMVSPVPSLPTPFPPPLPPLVAGTPLPIQQPGVQQPGMMVPYGMPPPQSPYGNPFFPSGPSAPPWGMAMVDPNTGQLLPNPYPQPGLEEQASDKTAVKDTPQSQMPTPRFHSVPTQPVFQRTAGLANARQAEEEQRLRQLKLERALGMKVPEGAKIAPNGVNQQILQTSAASGKGGGPVNGSPFSSINGILGMNESETQHSLDSAEKNYLKTQEQQILLQKAQIAGLQRELLRSRNVTGDYVVLDYPDSHVVPQVEQKSFWGQLFDSSAPIAPNGVPVRLPVHHEVTEVVIVDDEFEDDEFVEEEWIEEEIVPIQERSRLMPMQSVPNPPPLKTSRSHSFSPMGWLAPSADAQRAAQVALQRNLIPTQKKENPLTKWMTPKSQTVAKVQRPVGENPLLRQESESNSIRLVSQIQTLTVPLTTVSTEVLLEDEEESQPEWEEIVQIQFQEERQPVCSDGQVPRKNAPIPDIPRAGGARKSVYCPPVPQLSTYGKR